jgi:hypothetical protein
VGAGGGELPFSMRILALETRGAVYQEDEKTVTNREVYEALDHNM